jgi:gluconate:H+ symporter, GntP family
MTEGSLLFAALALGIVFIVVATTRWRMHPFLALILVAYAVGLFAGLGPAGTVAALTGGFGRTAGYIGIVIACGCIIGTVLEKSGCAAVMATAMLRLIGRTRAVLAMSCTGAVVSIPVFCDSGYVVLSPLIRSLARQTGISLAAFTVALSMGLYATHCLVPPTPGPIAVASQVGAEIGTVMLLGIIVALPVLLATYAYAQFAGRRILLDPGPSEDAAGEPAEDAASEHEPHRAWTAFAPILVPVLLLALKAVADLPARPLGDGAVRLILGTVGDPNSALVLGVLIAWVVVRRRGVAAFGQWTGIGLRNAGTIILITAAGGSFGGVLRETSMAAVVGASVTGLELGPLSIVLPFLVAAALKTAIGSSTVAMITTASLVADLLPAMGLGEGLGPVLATLSISCGAMMVSHANDSYFWVITQMSGMSVSQGYQLVTVASAIAGITGILVVLLMSLILV